MAARNVRAPIYLYHRSISLHSSPAVRARCEIIFVCRRGMLPVRRMPSSSLTSRTRHNKELSATDGGWPAPGDPVFSQTPTRTRVQTRVIRPQGPFKDHHLSGKWKKKTDRPGVHLTATSRHMDSQDVRSSSPMPHEIFKRRFLSETHHGFPSAVALPEISGLS